ncbi:Ferric siderophore transport system, periplasmic binding protein TonB [Labilithrix luteola]|uniref:Ferric siderophore transport system, periplasmic binding protein TonB n=1 Tax=Labilithrix luteola TaxID=1391654 RepID=A0A0K1PUC7_9BACT|nr:energy transducer TonB [Labilithrix luteola]AKU96976.1 Ferric siderophore transport system, periplasmic binding protein TonB [Labilithrix luteola]
MTNAPARPPRKPFDRYIGGTRPSWKRRAWFIGSLGLHGVAGAVLLCLSRHAIEAVVEPLTVTFVKTAAAPPPPPPPPPPPAGAAPSQPTTTTKPSTSRALVQPKDVPTQAPKPSHNTESEEEYGVVGGVVGGVPGGVVGGVVGGVPGGIVGGTGSGPAVAPAPPPPPPPGVYERVSRAPRLVAGDREPPIAPNMLLSLRGSSGVVLTKLKISVRGEVDKVEIVSSTIPLLDDVVKRHIERTWRFEPPINGGRPVAVEFLQPFSFNF